MPPISCGHIKNRSLPLVICLNYIRDIRCAVHEYSRPSKRYVKIAAFCDLMLAFRSISVAGDQVANLFLLSTSENCTPIMCCCCQLTGLCQLLAHNMPTLQRLEFYHSKFSGSTLNKIGRAMCPANTEHHLQHFALISSRIFDQTDLFLVKPPDFLYFLCAARQALQPSLHLITQQVHFNTCSRLQNLLDNMHRLHGLGNIVYLSEVTVS